MSGSDQAQQHARACCCGHQDATGHQGDDKPTFLGGDLQGFGTVTEACQAHGSADRHAQHASDDLDDREYLRDGDERTANDEDGTEVSIDGADVVTQGEQQEGTEEKSESSMFLGD